MSQDNHYDMIIIGPGAGGGTLAHRLAPSGKTILLLDRGGYVPREKDNWSTKAVNLEGKYQTKEQWHDKDGRHPMGRISFAGKLDRDTLRAGAAVSPRQPLQSPRAG